MQLCVALTYLLDTSVWNRLDRAPTLAAEVIAAAAEEAGVQVLHYDHDYDLIASITGQDTTWVVEKGGSQKGLSVLATFHVADAYRRHSASY
ncbi:MAG: hypothetical protein ACRDRX_07885 [Pseudonocardiaceae bacterium]